MPARSTKLSEKLVLIPESQEDVEDDEEEEGDFDIDNDAAPIKDDEQIRRTSSRNIRSGKSYAERLPKARRADTLARVTAYCTAQAYKLRATAAFSKTKHGAKTKLYDDCLYSVYHLPLLPGIEGYRIRSSPVLKSPGGKAVLDEEIERSENRDYHEDYFEDTEQYGVRGNEESESPGRQERDREARQRSSERPQSPNRVAPDAKAFAEMFVFSYGVAVFWNFTEKQEKDVLADLTFSESETGTSLVSRPQREEDFETEEFHFEYSPDIPRPRVFNDMITLRSGDHMIKLAMSHAIAQSTKLSLFEERMSRTMFEAQYVPKSLALTGHLGMKREDVVKILGRLFMSRVDVNLCTLMLSVVVIARANISKQAICSTYPTFSGTRNRPCIHSILQSEVMPTFSTSNLSIERQLTKFSTEYLEIKPRIQVLNERCRVFLDLAEILMDSIANKKMSRTSFPSLLSATPSVQYFDAPSSKLTLQKHQD
jgi:uncharacterized Rmd1/YagE family protein